MLPHCSILQNCPNCFFFVERDCILMNVFKDSRLQFDFCHINMKKDWYPHLKFQNETFFAKTKLFIPFKTFLKTFYQFLYCLYIGTKNLSKLLWQHSSQDNSPLTFYSQCYKVYLYQSISIWNKEDLHSPEIVYIRINF